MCKIINGKQNALLVVLGLGMGLAFLSGCNKKASLDSPKQTLTSYVEQSFKISSPKEKEALLSHMTGDLKRRLSAWSDEQFAQGFIENKRKYIKLSFRDEKKVSATQASVTYELTYDDLNRTPPTRVTTRRIATMVAVEGRWLISEVKNIKELIEYQNELSIP